MSQSSNPRATYQSHVFIPNFTSNFLNSYKCFVNPTSYISTFIYLRLCHLQIYFAKMKINFVRIEIYFALI